VGAWVSAEQ